MPKRMNKRRYWQKGASDIHVLHVVPGLGRGGMELMMAQLISGLTDERMRHSIACLKGEVEIGDRLPASTKIFCLHARPNEPQLPFRLARLVQKCKPDVIHSRNWGAWPDMALGRFLAWPIIPFIFSFHGLGKAGYMPKRRRLASRLLVHGATRLVTVSRQSRDMLARLWGWPAEKTEVIPNGVDTRRFYPINNQQKNGRIVVGSVGNLRSVKNHALILEACAPLVRNGMDLEIHIAGEGNQRNHLETLGKRLGLYGRLQLPGKIDDVNGFLNKLDIFVLSSDSEQHPNALNEAMACGVSCISTRVGCVDDLLNDGRCGVIIEPGDSSGLKKVLAELALDPMRRAAFGKLGLERVREHYSLNNMLFRYRRLYTGVAVAKNRGEK